MLVQCWADVVDGLLSSVIITGSQIIMLNVEYKSTAKCLKDDRALLIIANNTLYKQCLECKHFSKHFICPYVKYVAMLNMYSI